MRKHKNETIKRVEEEGKGFKTAKKKFSQGHFHLIGICEASGKSITNRERIVERTKETLLLQRTPKQPGSKQQSKQWHRSPQRCWRNKLQEISQSFYNLPETQ